MPSNEMIYVQVTATPENGGLPKAVVVLVPWESLEVYKAQLRRPSNDQAIAQQLADPLARNVFTHRAGFGPFRVAYSFVSTPPPEIVGQAPEFRHGALKAWIL